VLPLLSLTLTQEAPNVVIVSPVERGRIHSRACKPHIAFHVPPAARTVHFGLQSIVSSTPGLAAPDSRDWSGRKFPGSSLELIGPSGLHTEMRVSDAA
jgi:hypothetical protein